MAGDNCLQCGLELPPGGGFCDACGTEQVSPANCPRCALACDPGDRFCGECGWDLAKPPPRQPRAPKPKPASPVVAPVAKPEPPPIPATGKSSASAIFFGWAFVGAITWTLGYWLVDWLRFEFLWTEDYGIVVIGRAVGGGVFGGVVGFVHGMCYQRSSYSLSQAQIWVSAVIFTIAAYIAGRFQFEWPLYPLIMPLASSGVSGFLAGAFVQNKDRIFTMDRILPASCAWVVAAHAGDWVRMQIIVSNL